MATNPSDFLRNLVLYLVPMILSLTVHEYAHAFVAKRLGDDTAEREERLTLSPAAHVDAWGTLIFPTLSILMTGQALFGWARPVPFQPSRFRRGVDMRRGAALVSAAGPLSNLLLATISVAVLSALAHWRVLDGTSPTHKALWALLESMFLVNVGLCVFNLLPIPPFDGSRLLPRSFDDLLERIAPYSFLLLMMVLMVRPLRAVLIEWPIALLRLALLQVFGGSLAP